MTAELDAVTTLTATIRVPAAVDLRRTLSVHRRGSGDPQMRLEGGSVIWRACRTPEGPATVRVQPRRASGDVAATAWGAGGEWMIDQLPAFLGAEDDGDWRPRHPVLRELLRRLPGVRIGRSARVMEALVPGVLEQKVTGAEAWKSWRQLLYRYGEPAPGPMPLRLPPPPERLASLASWEWHGVGVEQKRALTIRSAALRSGRLEEGGTMGSEVLRKRLESLPGIGIWTSAEVAQRALGDADAVSVGDYHLPSLVGWSLAGRTTDDDGMLELLEPERPHRYRAVRLLELGGHRPARRGPRMPARNYRSM